MRPHYLGRSRELYIGLGVWEKPYMSTAILAGYLTARLSGTTFEQYMTVNVFGSLGMTDSTLDVHVSEALRARWHRHPPGTGPAGLHSPGLDQGLVAVSF